MEQKYNSDRIYTVKYMSCYFCQKPAPFKGEFFILEKAVEGLAVACSTCKKHIPAEKANPGSVKIKRYRRLI